MIELRDVTKSYVTRHGLSRILRGVNLRVGPGEHVGILGQNGAGKSTLIRVLSGSEKPTSGSVERGMSVSWPLAFGGAFLGSLTGADNVRFVCRLYGVDPDTRMEFVEDFTELGRYLNEPVRTYSSGMRARLAFATSMAVDFDCYLIDEIVAVGDDRFQRKCQVELFEKRRDRAMLFVSHSPDFIRSHCERASVLAAGELTNFDDVDSAFHFYSTHEMPMQLHMAPSQVKHLSADALERIATSFHSAPTADAFADSLDHMEVARAPVFDLCDLVGRLGRAGEVEAATALATYLTEQTPDEPLYWITLGDLLCDKRKHVPGVNAYRHALTLDPQSFWANRNLGMELFNTGFYEDAIPYLQQAARHAGTEDQRLELELRVSDCSCYLDRPHRSSFASTRIHVESVSALRLEGDCVARFSLSGLLPPEPDTSLLRCSLIFGSRVVEAVSVPAPATLQRLRTSAGHRPFAFRCYDFVSADDHAVEVRVTSGDEVLHSGHYPIRSVAGGTEAGEDLLAAARRFNALHKAEPSALMYGMSDREGQPIDIVPFAENLISLGLYDEALARLLDFLRSSSADHPDRDFALDLACMELARARLPDWRDAIRRLLEDAATSGRTASLATNEGHALASDGDLEGAAGKYEEASSIAADTPLIHFSRGVHTAKYAFSPDVPAAPDVPLTGLRPITGRTDIVHLFACDGRYFERFAASLVESSRGQGDATALAIHAHVIDPDASTDELAERLGRQFGLQVTTSRTPDTITDPGVRRAYLTCVRFLIAGSVAKHYGSSVLITEADCLINWPWRDLLNHVEGADLGYTLSGQWNWVPWTRIPAGVTYFADSEAGLEWMSTVSSFIQRAFARGGSSLADLWTVDQVALWLADNSLPATARRVHLPMYSLLTLATGDKSNVLTGA